MDLAQSEPPSTQQGMGARAALATALGVATAIIAVAAPSGLLLRLAGQGGVVAGAVPAMALLWVLAVGIVVIAAAQARRLTSLDRRAIGLGYFAGVILYLVFFLNAEAGGWRDAHAYYTLGLSDPYALAYSDGGVRYAPPFFQLVEPLRLLDWTSFLFLASAAQLAALWLTAGPIAAPLLLIPLVTLEAWYSNVNLLLAAAITFGFRWPALWSFVLLTKITPGIGLVWFAVRREWRSLAIALGATAAIVGVSWLMSPGLWASWFEAARSSAPPDRVADFVPLPVRVILAAAVVALGAMRNRPWTVPIAAAIAMPVLWPAALSVLVAVVPLSRRPSVEGMRRAVDWAVYPRGHPIAAAAHEPAPGPATAGVSSPRPR